MSSKNQEEVNISDSKICIFPALIKKLELKSLVSLDRGCQLLLQIDGADDELVKALVDLHKADKTVLVRIEKDND